MREVKTIGADDARRGIAAVRAAAERRDAAVVVAITDAYGELLALLRMDDAGPADIAPAIAKAYTAARLAQSTRAIDSAARNPKTGFDLAGFADPRLTGLVGGVPVGHGGETVGGVGVSGAAPDTDEALAEAGVAAMLAPYAPVADEEAR
ncbi:MAG: heme-binding protein [Acetobacteraceae bacterium]|nr:heme-binding protein [Acetobacteraceae bacterium]